MHTELEINGLGLGGLSARLGVPYRLGVYLKTVALLAALLAITACATLDRNDCEVGNWQEIGYQDGARGFGDEFLGLHQKACGKHGVSVEKPLYDEGYKAGLADFCQPETGYRLGRNEEIYSYVCPSEFENDFVISYALGLTETMAELVLQESFLEERLWSATVRHPTLQSSYEIAPASAAGRTVVLNEPRILDSLKFQIDNYRDRRARLRNALARADRFLKTAAAERAG